MLSALNESREAGLPELSRFPCCMCVRDGSSCFVHFNVLRAVSEAGHAVSIASLAQEQLTRNQEPDLSSELA